MAELGTVTAATVTYVACVLRPKFQNCGPPPLVSKGSESVAKLGMVTAATVTYVACVLCPKCQNWFGLLT